MVSITANGTPEDINIVREKVERSEPPLQFQGETALIKEKGDKEKKPSCLALERISQLSFSLGSFITYMRVALGKRDLSFGLISKVGI